jgi:hypothetical protein
LNSFQFRLEDPEPASGLPLESSKAHLFPDTRETGYGVLLIHFLRFSVRLSIMALSNFGSLILNLLIFITTLVNFSYALTALEPLVLLGLYAITKIYMIPPEEGVISMSGLGYLFEVS